MDCSWLASATEATPRSTTPPAERFWISRLSDPSQGAWHIWLGNTDFVKWSSNHCTIPCHSAMNLNLLCYETGHTEILQVEAVYGLLMPSLKTFTLGIALDGHLYGRVFWRAVAWCVNQVHCLHYTYIHISHIVADQGPGAKNLSNVTS